MEQVFLEKIRYLNTLCDFCGTCVAVCPHDAIVLAETDLEILDDRCTLCRNCVDVCPVRALEMPI